jgi:hypothetical protein
MVFLSRPAVCLCLFSQFWASFSTLDCDNSPPQFTSAPAIARNPNPQVPLAAILTFTTDEPARVTLRINDGWRFDVDNEFHTEHSIPVLGLRAGTSNSVGIFLTDALGNTSGPVRLEILTEPLPPDFPPIQARVHDSLRMEPGVTLFGITRTVPAMFVLVAVNNEGEVVWYRRGDRSISDVRRIRNGNLLFLEGTDAVEMDMLGNIVQKWRPVSLGMAPGLGNATPVNTATFHHEIAELPWGSLLTLSTEVRRLEGYPSSETDPGAAPVLANVVGDVIVEFARDGSIIKQWPLLDILDPTRIGYDSLGGFWNSTYRDYFANTKDWAHANAVSYDASDDSFIVSSRNQDAVIKIRRWNNELLWILGNHGGWNGSLSQSLLRPSGTLEWPFHQHAPQLTPQRTILLFDNGVFRARPSEEKVPTPESYSRAVEYSIDAPTNTISQTWSYGGASDELFYSPILGDAESLPLSGNVLITDGARTTDMNGRPADITPGTSRWARVVEVTHTQPADKVFELIIGNPDQPSNIGWTVYRSKRLASLYPPVSGIKGTESEILKSRNFALCPLVNSYEKFGITSRP